MIELFYKGGPLFMGILSILFISMVVWMIFHLTQSSSSENNKEQTLRNFNYGRSIGLLALIIGILGQLIGFYSALSAMELHDVSPTMVVAGIKVSMITTLYGMLIYIISLLLWFGFSQMIERK
ncbi:MotA/TolQ/ExbB proton channel family protein [Labilibacter marinus]|uniref:MotA/TolQ/ExbB proton channel family protein n=1 Tax=Labilibacter marinus TaxID=1477105 RepID=UPI00094FA233|nr:MotA/TolQ/ExbB proton channel family protein [Labilibacter marinus]